MNDWAKRAEDQEIIKLVLKNEKEVTNSIDEPKKTKCPNDEDSKNSYNINSVPEAKSSADKASNQEQQNITTPDEKSLLMKIIRKGTVKKDLYVQIQNKDPTSTLYSIKNFEELRLKPELLKGIYAMGFNAPSKIQEITLPALLSDPPQNMIAQSQSGTGKTAAFVLAMLSRVDTLYNYPQVICLSPTCELAIQTGEVAAKMAQFCPNIKFKFAVRGQDLPQRTKISEHILIGTPGKIMDWGLKFRAFDLKKIRVFVLDEADVMIATQSHYDQCIRIHKQLSKQTCQIMFFSATYERDVMNFVQYIVPNPIIIQLKPEEESLDNIKQYYVKCTNQNEKYQALQNIYAGITIGQGIIFCHKRKTVGWLASKLSSDGHSVAILSGDLTVEQRLDVLNRFRAGLEKVLITTNVLPRGINVEKVTLVVNFDLPMDAWDKADCKTYLHHIGRTGRFGKSGIAINLVDSDKSMKICQSIENHFKKEIVLLNTDNIDEIAKLDRNFLL